MYFAQPSFSIFEWCDKHAAGQASGAERRALLLDRAGAAAVGVSKWKHGLGNLLLLAGMAPITLFCCSSRASFAGRMPAATASIFCPFPA